MAKQILALLSGLFFLASQTNAQEDWENYVLYMKDRPISVVVDLGFGGSSYAKEKQNAIIISIKLDRLQKDGLPLRQDLPILDTLEEKLVVEMSAGLSSIYTGRYTTGGKRDFYFYSTDTSGFRDIVQKVLTAFPQYTFKVSCSNDPQLVNYKEVLYPTQVELQRIYNRRMVDRLVKAGDVLNAPRAVDHLIYFKTDADRRKYLSIVTEKGFVAIRGEQEKGVKERPYSLEISRLDKVDDDSIEEASMYLWELALKFGARYEGWETFVVKTLTPQ